MANTNACNIPSKSVKNDSNKRLRPDAKQIVSKTSDPRIILKCMPVMSDPPKIFPNKRNDIEIIEDNLLIMLSGAIIKKGLKKPLMYERIP